jgi:hypothetical protein
MASIATYHWWKSRNTPHQLEATKSFADEIFVGSFLDCSPIRTPVTPK